MNQVTTNRWSFSAPSKGEQEKSFYSECRNKEKEII
jgi:hypothetical protein